MNLIKSKLKDRMEQPMLESILHIRAHMVRNKICCHKFKVTEDMPARNRSDMYETEDDSIPEDYCQEVHVKIHVYEGTELGWFMLL